MTENDLVDVSTSGTANESSRGWVYVYPDSNVDSGVNTDEQTTGGAIIVQGCVIWPSFIPQCGAADCTGTITSKGFLTQADFITGRPTCGGTTFDSKRSIQVGTGVPPPPILRTTFTGSELKQSFDFNHTGRSGSAYFRDLERKFGYFSHDLLVGCRSFAARSARCTVNSLVMARD